MPMDTRYGAWWLTTHGGIRLSSGSDGALNLAALSVPSPVLLRVRLRGGALSAPLRTRSHSEHPFPAPSFRLCQRRLRHWRGTPNSKHWFTTSFLPESDARSVGALHSPSIAFRHLFPKSWRKDVVNQCLEFGGTLYLRGAVQLSAPSQRFRY